LPEQRTGGAAGPGEWSVAMASYALNTMLNNCF
jgi:hypothetical protein